MKTMYERMSCKEKKELYKEYKKDKSEFVKKMERMFLLCRVGIIYSIFMFLFDMFVNKSNVGYFIDIVIFVFCVIVLIKTYSTKKELLNNYALEKAGYKKKNKRS